MNEGKIKRVDERNFKEGNEWNIKGWMIENWRGIGWNIEEWMHECKLKGRNESMNESLPDVMTVDPLNQSILAGGSALTLHLKKENT